MKFLLLFCAMAQLSAASSGLRGNLVTGTNEECEACTIEQRQRGLCKPCSSHQDSVGKHSMYSSDHHTEDDSEEDDDNLKEHWRFPELRVVMIGHTGSGKSTTANTILGKKVFAAKASAFGVTTRSRRGRAVRFERYIQIVDTPGLFDPRLNNTDVLQEVLRCIGLISPGPHVFLLVIPIGRFSQEHKDTVKEFEIYLGKNIIRYTIVVFTRTGDLEEPLSEYIKDVPEKLEELLKEAQFRYIGFDNKASAQQTDAKVQELLSMIDKMIAGNGGDCYTSEVFAEVEKKLKQKEEEMRRQNELEKKQEKEKIEREFQKKMNDDMEQRDKEIERLKQQIKDLEGDDDPRAEIQKLKEEVRKQQEDREEEQRKHKEEMEQLKIENDREYENRQRNNRERIRDDINRGVLQWLWDGVKGVWRFIFGG